MPSTIESIRALRILFHKKLRFIRARQQLNDAPSEEQLTSFLSATHSAVGEIVEQCDDPDELAKEMFDGGDGAQFVAEALPADTPFDQVDDELEKLVSRARSAELKEAAENTRPSREELDDDDGLSLAVAKLWDLDVNKLEPGLDYVLNLQGGKRFYDNAAEDRASEPLFRWVSPAVWRYRPTYRLFRDLLDNYETTTGIEEEATQEEKDENWAFINAILKTPVMQYVRRFVASKRYESARGDDLSNYENFKRFLYQTWFYFYRRDGQNDSSAFEHVFLGEIRDGEVIGMHNWIHIMMEERAGTLDYKGYIQPRRYSTPRPAGEDQVMGVQIDWQGCTKRMSSIFVGTSPEFEVALYTLMYAAGVESVKAGLDEGDLDVEITVHKNGRGRYTRIGSAFPSIVE